VPGALRWRRRSGLGTDDTSPHPRSPGGDRRPPRPRGDGGRNRLAADAEFYRLLSGVQPSPVVELNRAVAVARPTARRQACDSWTSSSHAACSPATSAVSRFQGRTNAILAETAGGRIDLTAAEAEGLAEILDRGFSPTLLYGRRSPVSPTRRGGRRSCTGKRPRPDRFPSSLPPMVRS
jgi:hypothetical protein